MKGGFLLISLCLLVSMLGTGWAATQVTREGQANVTIEREVPKTTTTKETENRRVKRSTINGVQVETSDSSNILQPRPFTEQPTEDPAIEANPDLPLRATLTRAWQQYHAGQIAEARVLFQESAVSKEDEIQQSAQLGLAYCLLRLAQTHEASVLFQQLFQQGYQPEASGSALLQALLSMDRLNDAVTLLRQVPKSAATTWRGALEQKLLQRRLDQAIAAADTTRLEAVISGAGARLLACEDTEQFFAAAQFLHDKGKMDASGRVASRLASCRTTDKAWQLRLFPYRLAVLDDRAIVHLLTAKGRSGLKEPDMIRQGLEELWQRLGQRPSGSPDHRFLAEALVRLSPTDRKAVEVLAWSCYNQQDYPASNRLFKLLLRHAPHSEQYILGLCYGLQASGHPREAIAVIKHAGPVDSDKVRTLLFDLQFSLGRTAFASKHYLEAAMYLEAALCEAPQRTDARELLAWSWYRLGHPQELLALLSTMFAEQPTMQTARLYLDLLQETGKMKQRTQFLAELGHNEAPALRRLAADTLNEAGHPILAASLVQAEDTCYAGCSSPQLESTIFLRQRDGESGSARLDVLGSDIAMLWPTSQGYQWGVHLIPMHLSSGDMPTAPQIGSYYRSLENPAVEASDVEATSDIVELDFGLRQEGESSWQVHLGSTPFGGPIAPMPTFSVALWNPSRWTVVVEQEPVRESRLSWIGMKDPYSGLSWGRVLRSGIRAEGSVGLQGPWWIALAGEYKLYWGENVVGNQHLAATISWGRTDTWLDLERSIGLFASAKGFERNADFFTMGYGGYYSPELMLNAGPFLHLTREKCSRFWWDGQLSLGYGLHRTAGASRYWGLQDPLTGSSTAAEEDIATRYEGSEKFKLSADARLRGLYHLDGPWFLGIEAGISNNTDFTEIQAALQLRYRFGSGTAFCFSPRQLNNSLIPMH